MADRVVLEAPLDEDFGAVIRLIVGGIAERADFGFEDLDDLQLAIERLLVEAGSHGRVTLAFDLWAGQAIRMRVGPLRERGLAQALQNQDRAPGSLTLGRILETVVDSFGVDVVEQDEIVVRLEKLVEALR